MRPTRASAKSARRQAAAAAASRANRAGRGGAVRKGGGSKRAASRNGKPPAAPTWDLRDLYAGVDDPAIGRDLAETKARAASFRSRHAERLLKGASPDAGAVAEALAEYERIIESATRVASFAQLLHESDTADARHGALLATVMQETTEVRSSLMFLELDWMDLEDDVAERLMADPRLSKYRHYLWVARRYRPHKLSEPQEQVVNRLANTGSRAWQRYFDEFTAGLRFDVKVRGKTRRLSQSEALSLLHDADRDTRKAAADALTAGLRSHERTLAYVFNVLLWDHQIDDEMRRFAEPMAARNLDNLIDAETVAALMAAVESGYPIVQRYYRLKARLLGLKRLTDYDRYAPVGGADPAVEWRAARERVTQAFAAFCPAVRDVADCFFERRWIDAAVRPDKSGGAFSAPTVPSVHPYILMNFTGRMRDVMTLAHELGHGVHQHLSREQGLLLSSPPLTLAETASVFGEMLVFERLMAEQTDPDVRLGLLCHKIEDAFATVFRQTAMTRFEQRVHAARREKGELAVEDFNRAWLECNRAMFGDSIELTQGYGWWWSYIPHFVNSPFYCYAYAFGELLVTALIRIYRERRAAGDAADFVERYLALLRAGGNGTPEALLAPFGIDVRDPAFWRKGIEFLDDIVRQAEELVAGDGARRRRR